MSRVYVGTTIGAPTPTHTMTESAEEARRSVRSYAERKRQGEPVVKHERPHSGTVPAAAQRLARAAEAAGFEVRTALGWATLNAGRSNEAKVEAVQVGGMDRARRRGFRASWVRGKASAGTWYEYGVTDRAGDDVGVAGVTARVNG